MPFTLPNYHIGELLHESPTTLVYRAKRQSDGLPVVVKLPQQDLPDAKDIIRYKQEFEVLRHLEIAHVIKTYGLQNYEASFALVNEDFGGISLQSLMQQRELSLEEILRMSIQVCQALAEIHHAGIIHKDLCPSNIVINTHSHVLKLIDFGISTRFSRQTPTLKNPNKLEGTLAYIAPEQTGRMNQALDYRADFYSLGVILYELLNGELPFSTENPQEMVYCHLAQEPQPLDDINPQIPKVVSNIVMKLMEKTAAQRYQSAWGIAADLEQCLTPIQNQNHLEPFSIAQNDISERFKFPQILYGRDQEVDRLLDHFEQASMGQPQVVMVTGYSGIGKSSLVREIYKPITRQRGYFICGKFDQYQHNIPYSALTGAFQDFVRQILTESPEAFQEWKAQLLHAVGVNGQVIIEVIPEVELIIGPQPLVSEVGPLEATNRFHLTFQRFIGVLCRPERPLVLYLDDLQWADLASLHLMKAILSDDQIRHVFVIGSYRDHEVSPTHPLTAVLEDFAHAGINIEHISLTPLRLTHITQLIADTFHRSPGEVAPLAKLVQDKTEGNPFFALQFLQSLYEQELVNFDVDKKQWTWNIDQIGAQDMTVNVVDLMVEKLKKLPGDTQQILRLAACLGNSFDITLLSFLNHQSLTETYHTLYPALEIALLLPVSDFEFIEDPQIESTPVILHMKFLHDRIRQAAYSLVTEEEKPKVHLQIGQVLLSQLSAEDQNDYLFEIVDHFNVGRHLLGSVEENIQLARLNLAAGRRAKEAIAFGSAKQYLKTGIEQLPETMWQDYHDLMFDLHKEIAETEYVLGDLGRAEALATLLLDHATTPLQKADIYRMIIMQQTTLRQYSEAIQTGRKGLALIGVKLPMKEYDLVFTNLYQEVNQLIGGGDLASLLNEPEMEDPKGTIALQMLSYLLPAAYLSQNPLFAILCLIGVELSLRLGNRDESPESYSVFANLLVNQLGEYQRGREAQHLALGLAEKFKNFRTTCKTKLQLASWVNHWLNPLKESERLIDEAIQAGFSSGEFLYAGYAIGFKFPLAFFSGTNLEDLIKNTPKWLDLAERTKNVFSILLVQGCFPPINRLAGETVGQPAGSLTSFHEAAFIQACQTQTVPSALCTYYALQAQVCYLLESKSQALRYARAAEELDNSIKNQATEGVCTFFHSLILLEALSGFSESEREEAWKKVESNQRRMKVWAEHCPENWRHKYLLVKAEIARKKGNGYDPLELYDQAIASAGQHTFLPEEALGNELYGKFWLQHEKQEIASVFLRKAHYLYGLWGAKAKVQQLEQTYGNFLAKSQHGPLGISHSGDPKRSNPVISTSTGTAALDLETVLQAYRAIADEIHLDRLVKQLIAFVLKEAGAQRGVLILEKEGQLVVEAEGQEADEQQTVLPAKALTTYPHIWEGLIRYVARTRESVTLSNASYEGPYTDDSYVKIHQPKSVLCTPIIHHGQLTGLLYLENYLLAGAFTPERVELLQAISAQAAISLKNAFLYHNLMNEITERKQAEADLRGSEERFRVLNEQLEERVAHRTTELTDAIEELESFSYSISHDLRAPLRGINGFAKLLQKQFFSELPSEAQRYLTLIRRESEDMGSLIQDLLTLSQVWRKEMKKVELNLGELIQFTFDELMQLEPKRNVCLNLSPEMPRAYGDPTLIRQLLVNLLSNAMKFSRDRDPAIIDIRGTIEETHHLYEFKDNGVGFDMRYKNKLFGVFQRLHSLAEFEGTGVGLAIVQRVIKRHRGEIWGESVLNEGARFSFTLPRKKIRNRFTENVL